MHAHDWPAGLAAGYLRWDGIETPSVMTIHNLAHQGLFPAERREALGIPESVMTIDGVEFHGQISFLKSGLFYADHVTTVSPTYAEEITTPERGVGLHGLLGGIASEGRLTGVVNGIGEDWDPSCDPHLSVGFDQNDMAGKLAEWRRGSHQPLPRTIGGAAVRHRLAARPSKGHGPRRRGRA